MSVLQDLHVLIVEDEPLDSEVLTSLISKLNIHYSVVSDGAELVGQLDDLANVDIIFLDLELPTVDGFELLNMIQQDGRFEHIPVVAYSSHINEMNNAHTAGFHGFLTKPVDGNSFSDHLQRILNGEGVWE